MQDGRGLLISAAVSFAATGKLPPVCSGRNGARSPLNRVYTVLTQARTGPPRRSESNESMEVLTNRPAGVTRQTNWVTSRSTGARTRRAGGHGRPRIIALARQSSIGRPSVGYQTYRANTAVAERRRGYGVARKESKWRST